MAFLKFKWLDRLNTKVAQWLAWFAKRFPRTSRFLGLLRTRRRGLTNLLFLILHIAGFFMSLQAVMQTRTSQGAVAWAISLNTIPLVAVPGWLMFGDSQLGSYLLTRQAGLVKVRPLAEELISNLEKAEASVNSTSSAMKTLARLSSTPVLAGNHAELLVDGKNTFESIFKAIDGAEDYILVQFYIMRADKLGSELREKLVRKVREGVKVYVLVDDVGSMGLPKAYLAEMREEGIHARMFMDTSGEANRFQLNFRNHRKIVVVDGKAAFLGGHNVGDEYLGKHPTRTPWRDSHVKLTGPVVKTVQVPFVEDWYFATGEIPEGLDWSIAGEDFVGDMEAVCLASGPADPVETCSLFYLTAINEARERLWLATPYFVPDKQMVSALQLAAIRGVDVRVILPEKSDSTLVHLSSFSYIKELELAGVKLYRYTAGFLHQKVVLIDQQLATVGSANFDNRSFRLNFECTGVIYDKAFNDQVARMLERDFENCRRLTASDYEDRTYLFRLAVRTARLLAPIQ